MNQRISASRHTAACRRSRAELWNTVSARLIWNSDDRASNVTPSGLPYSASAVASMLED